MVSEVSSPPQEGSEESSSNSTEAPPPPEDLSSPNVTLARGFSPRSLIPDLFSQYFPPPRRLSAFDPLPNFLPRLGPFLNHPKLLIPTQPRHGHRRPHAPHLPTPPGSFSTPNTAWALHASSIPPSHFPRFLFHFTRFLFHFQCCLGTACLKHPTLPLPPVPLPLPSVPFQFPTSPGHRTPQTLPSHSPWFLFQSTQGSIPKPHSIFPFIFMFAAIVPVHFISRFFFRF